MGMYILNGGSFEKKLRINYTAPSCIFTNQNKHNSSLGDKEECT